MHSLFRTLAAEPDQAAEQVNPFAASDQHGREKRQHRDADDSRSPGKNLQRHGSKSADNEQPEDGPAVERLQLRDVSIDPRQPAETLEQRPRELKSVMAHHIADNGTDHRAGKAYRGVTCPIVWLGQRHRQEHDFRRAGKYECFDETQTAQIPWSARMRGPAQCVFVQRPENTHQLESLSSQDKQANERAAFASVVLVKNGPGRNRIAGDNLPSGRSALPLPQTREGPRQLLLRVVKSRLRAAARNSPCRALRWPNPSPRGESAA